MNTKFTVDLLTAHPDADDCESLLTHEFDTADDAFDFFDRYKPDSSTAYLALGIETPTEDSDSVLLEYVFTCKNPNYKPPVADDGWRREQAMQAGMGGGCEAYNAVMGWDE